MVSAGNAPITTIPQYGKNSEPRDGDTQADTIKALQAYAKEAVDKAERLRDYTKSQAGQVEQLSQSRQDVKRKLQTAIENNDVLKQELAQLKQQLLSIELHKPNTDIPAEGIELPSGLGFDQTPQFFDPNQGQWYQPIDKVAESEDSSSKFSGLLPQRLNQKQSREAPPAEAAEIKPAYTLPKDAILTDSIALTALVGRIPVNGQTPDPYPIKIFVGRDNLLANDHQLPEIEGMLLSGLGVGDVNLSCVSARLYSASFIFSDGSIVNQTSDGKPLAYISDPTGFPCVSGRFITNAPQFIAKRIGLAGLGAAGAAYAAAQQQTQTSSLTGTTTSSLTGTIDKLVAGKVAQSATEEVSHWLLERQKQSFDAVVVDPGAAVAVHIEQAILIDYDQHGRKVRYGNEDDFFQRNYFQGMD